jgi:hypothetical protein
MKPMKIEIEVDFQKNAFSINFLDVPGAVSDDGTVQGLIHPSKRFFKNLPQAEKTMLAWRDIGHIITMELHNCALKRINAGTYT